ncbi:MAG: hypothetical protein V4553_07250 [Bacteroidota bacterium]
MAQLKDKELNDAKYWELKYKYEFLIAIVGIITATAGFLGYNSLQSIEAAVRSDFDKKVDSVKTTLQATYSDVNSRLLSAKNSVANIDNRVKNSQAQLKTSSEVLAVLTKKQFELNKDGLLSKKNLKELAEEIDSINGKNKIKREFYLVSNMAFSGKLSVETSLIKLKFSDLKTITGDRLPVFKKPPIVLSTLSYNVKFDISLVTNENIEGYLQVYGVPMDEKMSKNTYYTSFIIYPVE